MCSTNGQQRRVSGRCGVADLIRRLQAFTPSPSAATESAQTTRYLHLRVTDNAGNATDTASSGYKVIAKATAEASKPTITLTKSPAPAGWTKEPVSLSWSVTGGTAPCTVTYGGISSIAASGTIVVIQNGLHTVSVRDANGMTASASCVVNEIDAEAPALRA